MGGVTTVAAPRSALALEHVDIAVIIIYFITVVAVGIWVRPGSAPQATQIIMFPSSRYLLAGNIDINTMQHNQGF